MKRAFALLALLVCFSVVVAEGENATNSTEESSTNNATITHLTADNINEIAYSTPYVVLFFAPWCPHCQAFRPTFEEFASHVAGQVGVGDVDCTVELYLQDLFGIDGYPTVFYFADGMVYQYSGERTTPALEEYINGGYKSSWGKPLPEVSSIAALNYNNAKKLTRTIYTILVSAVVLGVIGVLVYFCCSGSTAQKKGHLAMKGPHIIKYEPQNKEVAHPSYDETSSFLRQETA